MVHVPVLQALQNSWPEDADPELAPFYSRKNDLSLLNGCILWGSRVIVPKREEGAMLEELHVVHPGIRRMKSLARMYVWWPGLDRDIEQAVKECKRCQIVQSMSPLAPIAAMGMAYHTWILRDQSKAR